MKKEKFIELATKYLSKEVTIEEKEEFELLLTNDKYNKLFNWIADKWGKDFSSNGDLGFSLLRGHNKLITKIKKEEPSFEWEKDRTPSFKHHTSLLKIAASIIFFVLVSTSTLYYLDFFKEVPKNITLNEKRTHPGQKSILTLFDGTKITLNANSTLKYPTHFGDTSREVYLEGEAYFEVVHNTKKPFIVHSGKVSTIVLGTKFNVSAFPNDNNIKVSLVEGKVVISNKIKTEESNEFYLKPKQQFVFNKKNKKRIIKDFNILKETGWKDNTFIFDNEPLENVLVKLERAFGVELKVYKKNIKDYKLKANIENESFWAVVKTIKYATGLDYKIVSENNELKKVIFFEKDISL
jgi:ferric-dicitrate binding protein FerR (iron transport regulator)